MNKIYIDIISKNGGLNGNIRYFLGTTNMGSTMYYFQVYSCGRSLFLNFVALGDATQKPLFKIDEISFCQQLVHAWCGVNSVKKVQFTVILFAANAKINVF